MLTRFGQDSSSHSPRKRAVSCGCLVFARFQSLLEILAVAGGRFTSRRGLQAHEVVCIVRRLVEQATEWQIPIFVMIMFLVPPVLASAWLREYRRSDSFIQMDEIMTPWIRRTRAVPQGDPCAADLFGATLDVPVAAFCEMCPSRKW